MHKSTLRMVVLVSLCALTGCKPLADLGILLALWSVAENDSSHSSHSSLSTNQGPKGAIEVVGLDEAGEEVPADCVWSLEDDRVHIGDAEASETSPSWLRYAVELPAEADGSAATCRVGAVEERVVLRLAR